jgi:hypothetical protein
MGALQGSAPKARREAEGAVSPPNVALPRQPLAGQSQTPQTALRQQDQPAWREPQQAQQGPEAQAQAPQAKPPQTAHPMPDSKPAR